MLRNATAHNTLRNILSWSRTGQSRTLISPLVCFADPLRRPVQRADRLRPRRSLHSRSRQPMADRRPRGTGRHDSLTIAAGGHCHLPRDDQPPTPLSGGQKARESRTRFAVHGHRASFDDQPVGKLAMQDDDIGCLAQPD